MEISKLLTPKRGEAKHEHEGKQLRRSKRIRFQPLKYWQNESIVTDPKQILTMKDVEEKDDALLSLHGKRKNNHNNKKKDEENDCIMNRNTNEEFKCAEWNEYRNDDYYSSDNFNGTAWVNDDDKVGNHKIKKCLVSLPNEVKMNKSDDIYGGSMRKCKQWSFGFVEIPPKSQLTKELATTTTLFFAHYAQNKCVEFILFTKTHADSNEQPKKFYLSQSDMFYVPKGHFYELKNLSKEKVHLTVTQFLDGK